MLVTIGTIAFFQRDVVTKPAEIISETSTYNTELISVAAFGRDGKQSGHLSLSVSIEKTGDNADSAPLNLLIEDTLLQTMQRYRFQPDDEQKNYNKMLEKVRLELLRELSSRSHSTTIKSLSFNDPQLILK